MPVATAVRPFGGEGGVVSIGAGFDQVAELPLPPPQATSTTVIKTGSRGLFNRFTRNLPVRPAR
jgi:hypothetical protein